MQAILTVTDTKVVCLCVVMRKDGHYHIETQTEEVFSPIRRNKPVTGLGIRYAVQRALSRAQKQAGKRIDEVHVGVPGAFCQTVVENAFEQDEDGHDEYLYGDQRYELIDKYDIRGHKTVMILSLRAYTNEITSALDAMHLCLRSLYVQTKILGLYLMPRSAQEQVAILLDMGYYHSDICVFTGEGQVYSASMYLGGAHVTADLSQILELEMPLAEKLKRQFAFGIRMEKDTMDYVRMPDGRLQSFSHELVENIITARVDEVCELIVQTLEHSTVAMNGQTRIFLLGEGIRGLAGIREYIGSRLGYATEGLPIAISDGTTQMEPLSISLLEHVMSNTADKQKRRLRFFGRFARK